MRVPFDIAEARALSVVDSLTHQLTAERERKSNHVAVFVVARVVDKHTIRLQLGWNGDAVN